jgi:hypothetical protein
MSTEYFKHLQRKGIEVGLMAVQGKGDITVDDIDTFDRVYVAETLGELEAFIRGAHCAKKLGYQPFE